MAIWRVQAFYEQRAKLYQRFFVDFLQWEKVLETFFAEHNFLRPGLKVMDAGCGTGSVTKVLYHLARQQGLADLRFYGFDLTPAMLALFQQWIEAEEAQGIQLRQADVLDLQDQLPGDWQGFDWVISSAMLEYLLEEKRDQALRNLKGLLHENGKLILFLTKRTWITQWAGGKWWGTNLFDPDEIATELSQAGYTDIQERRMPKSWSAYMMAVQAGVNAQPGVSFSGGSP